MLKGKLHQREKSKIDRIRDQKIANKIHKLQSQLILLHRMVAKLKYMVEKFLKFFFYLTQT